MMIVALSGQLNESFEVILVSWLAILLVVCAGRLF